MSNMLRLHPLYHSHTKILHIKLPLSSNFLVSMAMPSSSISNSLLSSTKPFFPSFSTFTCLHSRFLTPPNTLIRSTHSTNSHPLSVRTSPLSSAARSAIPPPVSLEGSTRQTEKLTKVMMKLKVLGIEGHNPMPGQYRVLCPMCSGGDSGEKSLALNISADGNTAMWHCFRGKCGWEGNTMAIGDVLPTTGKSKQIIKATKRVLTKDSLSLEPLGNELLSYFAVRMISASTLRRNHVMQRKNGDEVVVAFTYMRDKALVGCKYLDKNKNFSKEEDTEKIFYGIDDIRNATDIIIVQGEVDKLSLEEAGFLNCVSVPDGPPTKVRGKDLPSPDQDTEYQYLWNCKEYFDKASRIILATVGDQPGQALAEELARRLGRERCWRVKWPKKNEVDFKDANEVLTYLGRERLIETIESAELYPIQGLFYFRDYFPEIDAYYHRVLGDELGLSSGWRCLDEYYNVVPGELTIVTGIPNSGKSEWIDALLCNLNESVGWKFVLCSMENKVREHARKLMEKHLKKPFFDVRYGETAERMTVEELEQGKEWLDNTFHLIRCENDSLPSIKWVLQLAKAAVLRYGVRGLVIDPYNELDHQRNKGMTETEYVSQMLTMVKRFAQHYSCHVWFVAHPKQLQNWKGTVPNMYDISGSAHFINKCDNGIVVHRNRDPEAGPIDRVQICVKKVRNKVAGTIGEAFLTYNRITGEFVDLGS